MKLSVLSSVMLIPAFFLMSCSQGGPNLSDSSKASIGGIASADNNSASEPMTRSLPRKKRPKAFEKYNISFWDSLKTKEQHRSAIKMVALSHESNNETSDFSQMKPGVLWEPLLTHRTLPEKQLPYLQVHPPVVVSCLLSILQQYLSCLLLVTYQDE